MASRNNNNHYFIFVLTVSVILYITVNLVTPLFEESLIQLFGSYYKAFILFIFLACAILYIAGTLWKERLQGTDRALKKREKIIGILWENSNLQYQNKMDNRLSLDLSIRHTQAGTDPGYADRHFLKDAKNENEISAGLEEILNNYSYLLIIGEAGSGKSTLLLNLYLGLLDDAKTNAEKGIPVLLSLSSWNPIYKGHFDLWIKDVLRKRDRLHASAINEIMYAGSFIVLLDGLDEVGHYVEKQEERKEIQAACLEEIEKFLVADNPVKLAITSRAEEYGNIDSYAPVRAEVSINRLAIQQVFKELSHMADEPHESARNFSNAISSQNIRGIIEKYPELSEVFCIPFYFNLATQVFESPRKTITCPETPEAFKDYLLAEFVQSAIFETGKEKIFTSGRRNEKWLAYLAKSAYPGNSNAALHSHYKRGNFNINYLNAQVHLPISYRARWLFLDFLKSFLFYILFLNIYCRFLPAFGIALTGSLLAAVLIWSLNLIYKGYQFLLSRRQKQIKYWVTSLYELTLKVANAVAISYACSLFKQSGLMPAILICLANSIIASVMFLIRNDVFTIIYKRSALFYLRNVSLLYTYAQLLIILAQTFILYFFLTLTSNDSYLPYIPHLWWYIFLVVLIYNFQAFFGYSWMNWITGVRPLFYRKFLDFAVRRRILEKDYSMWRFRHQILENYFRDTKLKTPQTGHQ